MMLLGWLMLVLIFGWVCYRLGRDEGYEQGRFDQAKFEDSERSRR